MAALHAILEKDLTQRGRHSTTAHRYIQVRLQTWNGSITVTLDKDDNFEIHLGKHISESSSPGQLVAQGTVANGGDITTEVGE
jgi:hypothetical protein